ncbi:MAG TPA: type I glyceraldehyde-3-phosphate dehydrogenase [Anaerolineales bacterium]|nr:type I glyceraldehyde-3-phosphate dehydrogenase [Anaerolineales bacterium]
MTTKVGINGFGRIGRQVLKALKERASDTLEVVAINDLYDAKTNAHLFKYDSTYGRYPGSVEVDGNDLIIDTQKVKVFSERDPGKLPWGDLGVDIVIESTGVFKDADVRPGPRSHIDAGAKKVIISAPAKNEDKTLVMGVNDQEYDPEMHHVVSNASCTTNCLAPPAKIVHEKYGIVKALMTTVHAFTNGQSILDVAHRDLRRARTASANIIPTTTGAARAVALVIPDLKGRFDGYALRVPVVTVSIVDFVAIVERPADVAELNAAFKAASEGPLKGILGYCEEPLVSSDFIGDSRSSIIDAALTTVMDGNMVKVVTWYDNEWGYSCRTVDMARMIAEKL